MENIEKDYEIIQHAILKLLAKNKQLSKQQIFETLMESRTNINDTTLNELLDELWFNNMVNPENCRGIYLFSLTRSGKRKLDTWMKEEQPIMILLTN
jgi:arginine repressor